MADKPVTIAQIQEMKNRGEKISMVTGYDYPFARLLDQSGIDMILVGDSVGVVVAGYPNTLPVTVDEMIYHGKAVMRGNSRALVVIDMPFMSYQISIEDAKRQAGRIMQETGATAVKLEGGISMAATIEALVTIGIPVPTIGIGAGPTCDGQVLVLHDLLGLFDRFRPSFVKQYANLGPEIIKALQQYHQEVKDGSFPTEKHSFH